MYSTAAMSEHKVQLVGVKSTDWRLIVATIALLLPSAATNCAFSEQIN